MKFAFGLHTIGGAFRFFVPRKSLRSRLPLLPLKASSRRNPWGAIPEPYHRMIQHMMIQGAARTPDDGYRLIKRYPDKNVMEIVSIARRERRRRQWLRTFKRRLARIW